MGKLIIILYNFIFIPVFKFGFFTGSFFNVKMKLGRNGRKNLFLNLSERLSQVKPDQKRIWFHCTSVGEWEQAVPIIDEIKTGRPDIFVLVSFFSPSGYNYVKRHPNVDFKTYLPIDSFANARRFIRIVKPDLWVISKFDIWPAHLYIAGKMNIPVVLTAATLSSNSGRDKGLSKILNWFVYKNISLIFPISLIDRNRFLQVFPYPERMVVAGDTRFDQVFNKAQKVRASGEVVIFKDNSGIKLITGSIWPADEKYLLPALINLYKKYGYLKLILVPHELHEAHISDIENILSNAGIESERYTSFENAGGTTKRVAIINTIGMLARIYKQTQLAYVGGSFSSGVHNVMEPAVFGQPVVFGPEYHNSFEAIELIRKGFAFSGSNSVELETLLDRFVSNETDRVETGNKAKNLIEQNIGATQIIIKKLKETYDFIS